MTTEAGDAARVTSPTCLPPGRRQQISTRLPAFETLAHSAEACFVTVGTVEVTSVNLLVGMDRLVAVRCVSQTRMHPSTAAALN